MSEPFTPYQRRLFVFLSVATFFEGYDFLALTQILPNLRQEMGISEGQAGALVAFINVGTVLAYLLVRKADKWGRRRVLTATIAGYTVFTFLTGFAPNIWVFAIFQMIARVFLIGEWATSMVIAAEEFPAARRGMVLGVINAFASLGSVFCAGVVPLLLKAPWGWRTVYFVGIIPLVILAYARRNLRETQRFSEQVKEPARARPLMHVMRTPYRKRVLQLGLIWLLTYVCTQNGITFWKEFAVAERSFTDGQVGLAISIAAVAAMPLVFLSGKLIDVIGRQLGAAVIFGLASLGVFLSYSLEGQWALTGALAFGIFGASAVLPVLNAYSTELFPTDLRADAFSWANNLIGRVGYVLSPLGIGLLAGQLGWGPAVRLTAIFPIIAVVLIFLLLPETRNKELEETAAL
ncbi:MAG: MFS transporter [Polyangiaceae bacterium]|nr:MFS transporter [Polyangiaceae bacterium]